MQLSLILFAFNHDSGTCRLINRVCRILFLLLVIKSVAIAQDSSITIQLSPAKDNTIYERTITNSNGSGEYFIAGTTGSPYFNRALIQFNLDQIPNGASITQATLRLHLAGTSGNSGPYIIELHRLLQDWGEGSSNAGTQAGRGAPATTNDATWANSFYPVTNWTTPGGNFLSTISGQQTIDDTGYYNWSSNGMITDLQNWLNQTTNNFGWLLKSDEAGAFQAKRFESKDNLVSSLRPVLTISYSPPIPNKLPAISISNPVSGSQFNAGSTIKLSALANDTDGIVKNVSFFYLDNNVPIKLGEDTLAPYEFSGSDVEPGNYRILAKATDDDNSVRVSDTVSIIVTSCTPTGSFLASGYGNIPGNLLINLSSHPSYPSNPSTTIFLNKLEYGPDIDNNYGGKLQGYICAPVTGNYTFYIASDEQSELWLSSDDSQQNVRRIAWVETRVGFRSWFTFPTQKSATIRLIKGARYYIESVHKEGSGTDHLSIAWALPNGIFEGPILGNRLSPFVGSNAPTISNHQMFQEAFKFNPHGFKIMVTTNPFQYSTSVVVRSEFKAPVSLIITDMSGRIIHHYKNLAPNKAIPIGTNLATGVYMLKAQQENRTTALKLIRAH